jgi:hypothetical protein
MKQMIEAKKGQLMDIRAQDGHLPLEVVMFLKIII